MVGVLGKIVEVAAVEVVVGAIVKAVVPAVVQ